MIQTFDIEGLHYLCSKNTTKNRVAYLLYPMDMLRTWIEDAAVKYDYTLVVITGMDWDNDLTPWPAPGVPKGCPDFKGNAPEFLKKIGKLVMSVESQLELAPDVERTLVGVSLSGLFTLWQWPQSNLFHNIASLSGSFWYEGFIEWFSTQNLSDKTGFAFLLLGDKETQTKVKAFESVGMNTLKITRQLNEQGVNYKFVQVSGTHYQFPIERLNRAMEALANKK